MITRTTTILSLALSLGLGLNALALDAPRLQIERTETGTLVLGWQRRLREPKATRSIA